MSAVTPLMTHTVWLASKTGIAGDRADPTYSAAVSTSCRLDKKINILKDDKGNERQTTNVITAETEIAKGQMAWLDESDKDDLAKALEIFQVKESGTPDGSLTLWEAWA